jgi:EAL and modified HD-GYP domain-containing signal transduction protein
MEVFLARQPIFTSKKKIFGYELLFRLGLENVFPDIDGDSATSTLMSNIFFPFDFNEILGGKPGLINFTEKLILQKIPLLLSKEHFIIEVLEDIEPKENVISALSFFLYETLPSSLIIKGNSIPLVFGSFQHHVD